MCFLDKKKQLPGDEFDISVWKPLDTKGKPINQDEPLIYNHYSGKAYSFLLITPTKDRLADRASAVMVVDFREFI